MAIWKRLTNASGGKPVEVNMDMVCFMQGLDNATRLTFQGELTHNVKEAPDEILKARAIQMNTHTG